MLNMFKKIISNYKFLLLVIVLIAFLLRFVGLDKYPGGLNVDEVAIGYNAYSISKTARDENGKFLPLALESYGDFKPPVYIYLTIIPIKLFGLNEFSVRFISALTGVSSIVVVYFLLLELFNNKRYALAGSLFLAMSPWHIFYSRLGSESQTASFLILVGFLFLSRLLNKGGYLKAFLAAFFIVTSMYTYHTEKLFAPIMTILFLLINHKNSIRYKKESLFFVIFCLLFASPTVYHFFFGQDSARATMQFITKDNFLNNYVLAPANSKNLFLLLFNSRPLLILADSLRKLFSFTSPVFLFFNGLDLTKENTLGLGVMYLFEVPFFLLGVFTLIYKKIANKLVITVWILIGLLPAAITLGEHHTIRTLIIAPILSFISAVGAVGLYDYIKNKSSKLLKITLYAFSILIAWNLVYAYVVYIKYYPYQKGEWYMEGTKEAVLYAIANYDKYDEIVFDPARGITGPYTINVPHEYFLFYSKYDPAKYQNIERKFDNNAYSFDKITVRHIDLSLETNGKNILYISSPWSMPAESTKIVEVLKKIYLTSGDLALVITRIRK